MTKKYPIFDRKIPDHLTPGKIWHNGLIARLEPRLMFDGAVAETMAETTHKDSVEPQETQSSSLSLMNALKGGSGRGVAVIDTSVRKSTPLSIR